MDILLDALENDTRNAYEMTYAIVRRAYQITKLNEVRPTSGVVTPIPTAINQIITREVSYRLESK